MPRRKNTEAVEINLADVENEDTQILNSADIEADEAELLTVEENTEDAKDTPKPRARKSRKKDTEEGVEIEAKEEEKKEEETQIQLQAEAEEEVEAKPARRRSTRKQAEKDPAAITAESMEQVLKQWDALNQSSQAVANQFERMTKAITQCGINYVDTQEMIKPKTGPKFTFVQKFAVASSLCAILLSVLSLSLAQSARRNAILAQSNAKVESIDNSVEVAGLPETRRPFSNVRKFKK